MLRTAEETLREDRSWPNADVVVLPGLTGWTYSKDDEELLNPYPTTTTDMVKTLRAKGLKVEHAIPRENRQEVSLNAAEYWVPVLVFAADVAANTSGEVLAAAVMKLFGASSLRRSRLHVRFGQTRPDGTVDFFEAHGDAEKVLEAVRTHGKQERKKRKES